MSSTMKSGHQRSSPRGKFNDSNKSYYNRRDSGTYSNNSSRSYNGGYRRINKYRHHPRDPKNNIRFEYAVKNGDQDVIRVLYKMIDYLRNMSNKEKEQIKQVQKFLPKTVNEVSEDQIATISMEQICGILKEDIELLYDALVASDFIEEISEA